MESKNAPHATRPTSDRLFDPFYLVIVFLVFVLFSWAARADTYNFYFEPKNKGAKPAAQVQEEDTAPAPSEPVISPPPVVSPAPTVSAAPGMQQPIIINNNITVPNTFTYPQPVIAPTAPTPLSAVPSEETPAATAQAEVAVPAEKEKKWSLTLSAMGSSSSSMSSSSISSTTDEMKQKLSGFLLAASYRLSGGLEARLYTGAYEESGLNASNQGHLIAGLDVDFLPFRFGWGGMNFLELGFLLGASTLHAAADNLASLHAGLRGNLNLSQNWGLTAGVRANLGGATGEIGVVMHL